MASVVRVQVCENGKHQNVKVLMVNRASFQGLLKDASNKLRIKAKRIFNKDGDELFAEDLTSTEKVTENMLLVASSGADFVGYTKNKAQKQKEIDDIVVGLHGSDISGEKAPVQCVVRLIAKHSRVEDEAVKQMEATAKLPRMRMVVGLPDLHPGKGFPIGSASVSEDVIYPHLVGADIGCGMSLYKTSLKSRKLKLDQWTDSLHGLEEAWGGDTAAWLKVYGVEPTQFDTQSLGTIGGGNHFAELQQVEEIRDQKVFDELGLDIDSLVLLVHSGSRAYGESVLHKHLDAHGPKGLMAESEAATQYLQQHDSAMMWAKANRSLIAHRFLSCLTASPVNPADANATKDSTPDGSTQIFDVWHNCLSQKEFELDTETDSPAQVKKLWLHRKGAAPADVGPVVIPGSRGHFSYLVLPTLANPDTEKAAFSLAHGAGRKWNRGKALQMGKAGVRKADTYTTTELGSKVICENKDLLYEEVPSAYKEIQDIVQDLVDFNLVKVVAVFRPLITYKMRVVKYEK